MKIKRIYHPNYPERRGQFIPVDSDYLGSTWPNKQGFDIEIVNRCGFDTGAGWAPWRCGNIEPCAEHDKLTCHDHPAEKAVQLCSHAGSVAVCGTPCCESHRQCGRHR